MFDGRVKRGTSCKLPFEILIDGGGKLLISADRLRFRNISEVLAPQPFPKPFSSPNERSNEDFVRTRHLSSIVPLYLYIYIYINSVFYLLLYIILIIYIITFIHIYKQYIFYTISSIIVILVYKMYYLSFIQRDRRFHVE